MRPLLITDCDEVLLHMVRHFGEWLGEAHDIDFAPDGGDFAQSMRRRADGSLLAPREMWALLDGFFPDQMDRQTLVPHAREALARIAQVADIVVLTNLGDHCRDSRIAQLSAHGIAHRVECNQGGKGPPVARLVAEHGAPVAVFVDDLATHHESVAEHAPDVLRLHMIAEPAMAPAVPPAPHAHARIDDWRDAADWILAAFAQA
ncbi:HAD family hydrolase [Sphingomonas sp. RS6]